LGFLNKIKIKGFCGYYLCKSPIVLEHAAWLAAPIAMVMSAMVVVVFVWEGAAVSADSVNSLDDGVHKRNEFRFFFRRSIDEVADVVIDA
jgi:hypothetical protein